MVRSSRSDEVCEDLTGLEINTGMFHLTKVSKVLLLCKRTVGVKPETCLRNIGC